MTTVNGPGPFPGLLVMFRQRSGLSQQALGREVGLDQTRVSLLERGIARPTVEQARTIAGALGLDRSERDLLVSAVEAGSAPVAAAATPGPIADTPAPNAEPRLRELLAGFVRLPARIGGRPSGQWVRARPRSGHLVFSNEVSEVVGLGKVVVLGDPPSRRVAVYRTDDGDLLLRHEKHGPAFLQSQQAMRVLGLSGGDAVDVDILELRPRLVLVQSQGQRETKR